MPFIRAATWVVLLVSAMLLPYLPGRYDPLAVPISAAATAMAFGGLLLVPVGAVWLARGGGHAMARIALAVATLAIAVAVLFMAAAGSIAGATVLAAAWLFALGRWWRGADAASATGTAASRAVPLTLIVVPLVAAAARLTLVGPAAAWSLDRAIANAAEMIADIEQFRERTGAYPVAINSLSPDYHPGIIGVERYRYEPSGQAYNLYFEHRPTDLAVQEIVMYNPRGEQDFSSHAFDLLQLSPEEIRRQRGHFTSHDLPQAGWKRFLFD